VITDGLRVQVAFEANPDAGSPTWTDVTRYVRLASGISITRGRQDARSQPSVGTCAMTPRQHRRPIHLWTREQPLQPVGDPWPQTAGAVEGP
jgi:hypothetical protein